MGRKLFFSALLKILKQSQEVLRYWLSRDFVENRANVAADVCLKGEGKAVIRPNTLTLAWRASGVVIHCLVHSFAYAGHFTPAVLLSCVAVHNRSPNPRLAANPG